MVAEDAAVDQAALKMPLKLTNAVDPDPPLSAPTYYRLWKVRRLRLTDLHLDAMEMTELGGFLASLCPCIEVLDMRYLLGPSERLLFAYAGGAATVIGRKA